MRKFRLILAILFITALCNSAIVFAQSSGSFSASFNDTQCSITDKTGALASGIVGAWFVILASVAYDLLVRQPSYGLPPYYPSVTLPPPTGAAQTPQAPPAPPPPPGP